MRSQKVIISLLLSILMLSYLNLKVAIADNVKNLSYNNIESGISFNYPSIFIVIDASNVSDVLLNTKLSPRNADYVKSLSLRGFGANIALIMEPLDKNRDAFLSVGKIPSEYSINNMVNALESIRGKQTGTLTKTKIYLGPTRIEAWEYERNAFSKQTSITEYRIFFEFEGSPFLITFRIGQGQKGNDQRKAYEMLKQTIIIQKR